LIAIKALLL